ncbi:MAG: exodeoxyribonuclease VII large subunit [Ruminococcus sp.]|nr:exodeoxyribonuclease VII large subunit [Ruminococcus sp.]
MYTPNIPKPPVLSVSQVTRYIRDVLQSDPRLMTVFVTGEITDLKKPFRRDTHNYFMLKDSSAVISAAMFAGNARSVVFQPENGLKVICRGKIDFYPPSGRLQLILEDMQPDGIGALNLAYEQLKRRLEQQGLFAKEHKKPIPRFPRTVGVITSPTGAAFQDIKRNLYKRFPCVDVILYPTLVQGDAAPAQLTAAVNELDASGLCDTIIIGRGGGSIEDLWAFNHEDLARAIYQCHTPVISAVGHEIDHTICDFVADAVASTPTAAAVLAVPDRAELMVHYQSLHKNINAVVKNIYETRSKRLQNTRRMMEALSPQKSFDRCEGNLKLLQNRMQNAVDRKCAECEKSLQAYASKLESLNPLSVLARGYAVAEKDGTVITAASQVQTGDKITLTFSDGKTNAVISGE